MVVIQKQQQGGDYGEGRKKQKKPWKVNKTSLAYLRMHKAGFKLNRMHLSDHAYNPGGWMARVTFTCVCGTVEGGWLVQWGNLKYWDDTIKKVDVAQWIEDQGQFSEDHLREDGYTEEQIKEIRKPWEELV